MKKFLILLVFILIGLSTLFSFKELNKGTDCSEEKIYPLFMTFDKSGDIDFQPVSDLKSSIVGGCINNKFFDGEVPMLSDEMKSKYQTIELAETKKGAAAKYQTIELAETKKDAASKYQPKGKYLQLDKTILLQNKAKGGVLKDPSKGDRYGAGYNQNIFANYGDRGAWYSHNQHGGSKWANNQWIFRQYN